MFDTAHDALAFDLNVMLVGMAAEHRARQDAQRDSRGGDGFVASRSEAYALARRAREAAKQLELENAELVH